MIGKTLTHYEVTSLLGKGGMGEVWQAKDTKLGRSVAIKTLPAEFAEDDERVARFQREAKLLASLNHPNIAAIHGLEESDGTHFLVLELVEGDTLAERIRRGPVPVEEALDIAKQTVDALEAAHEKGVVHRDLKPANIKVTPEGKVKVLDFGLAKAFTGDGEDVNTSNSPTLSMAATQQGVILGTAAYMSPEQAKGIPVDKRSDIFSFGCVLFEMLTGRRAFDGDLATEVLAAIIRAEPDYAALQANLNPKIEELLRRCLEKDLKKRWRDVGDLRVEIEQVLSGPGGAFVEPGAVGAEMKPRPLLPWMAATFVIAGILFSLAVWVAMRPAPPVITRFTIAVPPGVQMESLLPTLSPDGRLLAFRAVRDGQSQIYIRRLDQIEALPVRGSEGANSTPIFSPDGREIAFNTGGVLRRVPTAGGPSVTLAEAANSGAHWGPDDTIVFRRAGGGLSIVPAVGGAPREITTPAQDEGESLHRDPQFLPDGRGILFAIESVDSAEHVAVLSLDTGEKRILVEGAAPRFAHTGHLLFTRDGAIWAVPFDTDQLQVQGRPVPMLGGVLVRNGFARYRLSRDGSLVYETGTSGGFQRTLRWVDRGGGDEPIGIPAGEYFDPRLSPDGTRVALAQEIEGNLDIWIWDLARKTRTRLTFDDAEERHPLWSLDGHRVAFSSTRDGWDVYWRAADGTGQVERLSTVPDRMLTPWSWSADGKSLLLIELALTGTTSFDIGMLAMEGDRPRTPLLQEDFTEVQPVISPDGRWMAYQSNESGRGEIYVRPYPGVESGKWPISTSGGNGPKWSRDGQALFYRSGRAINRVSVETGETFSAGVPETVYEGTFFAAQGIQWDIDTDGQRFLVIKNVESTGDEELHIVLNWFEELKEKVPVP